MVKLIESWMESFAATAPATHPLLLPLLFAELERKRLLDRFHGASSDLHQKITGVETTLRNQPKKPSKKVRQASDSVVNTQRDCDSLKLWIDASSLRNGLESFRTQLKSMEIHAKTLTETEFKFEASSPSKFHAEREFGMVIQSRLRQMINELQGEARSCDTVLGGLRLINQVVSHGTPKAR